MHTRWWKSTREVRRKALRMALVMSGVSSQRESTPCVIGCVSLKPEAPKHSTTDAVRWSRRHPACQKSGSNTSAAQRPCDASRDVPGRQCWQSAFHSSFLFMRKTRGSSRFRLSVVWGLGQSSAQFTVSPKSHHSKQLQCK